MRIGLQSWGSEGDVRPMLALAAGLSARGHTATLVVTGPPAAELTAAAVRHGVSLEVVSIPGLTDEATLDGLLASWVAERNPLVQARKILEAAVDPVVPAMTDAARRLCRQSDVVVAHFFVQPLVAAAQRRDIPCAVLHMAHTGLPSREICPPGFPALGPVGNRLGWAVTRRAIDGLFLARANEARAAEGLAPIGDVMREAWTSPWLTLLAVSPHIRPRPADWPASHHVCGFLDLPREAEPAPANPQLLDFLAAGPPPVFFTFGSLLPRGAEGARAVADIWREAARRAGCRAILQLPSTVAEGLRNDDRTLVVHRVAHSAVFPRCAAVVHHGGAGTVHTALGCGVPSVVVPHIADQFLWAAELRRLGVAGPIVPRRKLTPSNLAHALARTLADTRAADAARALARQLSTEHGVDVACSLIEENHHA